MFGLDSLSKNNKVIIIQNSNVDYKNLLAKRKYEKLCKKDEKKEFLKAAKKYHPLLEDLDYHRHDDDDCVYVILTRNFGNISIESSDLKKTKMILEVEDFNEILYEIPLIDIINIVEVKNPKRVDAQSTKLSWYEKYIGGGGNDPRC